MKYIRSLDVTRTPFCWVILGVFFLRADSCVTAVDRILTFPMDPNISMFQEEEIQMKEGRSCLTVTSVQLEKVDSPGGAGGKEPAWQCRRRKRGGFYPGSERSPGEGNGYPLQYSCLENPMDRGAWWATVHSVTETELK